MGTKKDWPTWLKQAEVGSAEVEIGTNEIVIWKGGIWEDGIWEGGIWEDGIWKGGIWEDGIWEGGEWKGGIWEDGIWKGGIWKDGRWEGGIWKDGRWEGGIWEGGIWEDGRWEGGIWKGGIWEDGIWEGGIWEDGIWEGGEWKGGTWRGGTWRGGIWEGGEWKGGTWRGGIWEGGKWKGGIWDGQEDRLFYMASGLGIVFDQSGYGRAYRTTLKNGRGRWNPRFTQINGKYYEEGLPVAGSGTCTFGIHVTSAQRAWTYFGVDPNCEFWEVTFKKEDLLDCDGEKARIRGGEFKRIERPF